MARDDQITFRTSTKVKAALAKAAEQDHRTLAALIELILMQWLREHGHIK